MVNEQGNVQQLRIGEIDKKIIPDRKTFSRDASNNALQVDDVVRVTNRKSPYYDSKGIIKCITKNVLFLWDNKF